MYKENETITTLKEAMGYTDDTECCASCSFFRLKTDGLMAGGPVSEPKGDRCALNVIEIPVRVGGRCRYFEKSDPISGLVTGMRT